ncbi:MAG: metal-dependent hydrolase [Candidatus Nanohaloarchaea archaeon]
MLGRQHLKLTVMTYTALIIPFLQEHSTQALIGLIGVSIGSLIPDIDSVDSAVFHSNVKGLGSPGIAFNDFIGPVLPLFAYVSKYLIYKPVVHLLNFLTPYKFHESHRSFTHSITGVATLTLVTGLLLYMPLNYIGLSTALLPVFLTAYCGGAFMHMLQDSCTKSGIAWNQPFNKSKIKGELITGKSNRRPKILLYCLTALTLLISYQTLIGNPVEETAKASILLTGITWSLFMMISGVRIKK